MNFSFADWLTGSGKYSVSVPVMDGALRPNDRLDDGEEVHRAPGVDNLTRTGEVIYFSVADEVLTVDAGSEQRVMSVASFTSEITCLSAIGDQFAVGLEAGEVRITGGRFDGVVLFRLSDRLALAPVAVHFEDEETLLIALGSQRYPPSKWKYDLMEGGASGSVWRIHIPSAQATLLAEGMAYPYGIVVADDGAVLVSESWAHRIVDISSEPRRVVVDDLPFYPARLSLAPEGDIVVCGFAPRRQLVEFVLRERRFRKRMMAEVPEPYWLAPALNSGASYWEPLQDGQALRRGILKPWAPTRSYGLVATMHQSGRFLESFHSRAGGTRHGTTSAVAVGSELFVTAKGGGSLVRVGRNV